MNVYWRCPLSGIPGSACSDSLNPVLGIWVGGDWGGFSEKFRFAAGIRS